jgi:hypothetical protein
MIKGTIMMCAWILWVHWAGGSKGFGVYQFPRFEVVQAYESRGECEKAQRQTRLTPGYDRFVCLPDTINDPR